MQLKRYTTQELQELIPNIFFKYMLEKGTEEVRKSYDEKVKEYKYAKAMYEKALSNGELERETKASVIEQLRYLEEGLKYLETSNIANQKKLYENTKSTDFCRSVVKIPLNKEINSFYDDLFAEVVFYDNVCTPNGKHEEYEGLESEDDKLEFLMRNIEITHIGLVYERNNRRVAILEVLGTLNYGNDRVKNSCVELLERKFSDFENLTLADTLEINNNDLKQWLQSKIDLDKEGMEELAKVFIRGDYYSIHKSPSSKDIYIRYVCRSTGRVYYNILNLNNLKLSDYYKENDYESYAKAWWNLTHLGSKVEGKPIIAC